MSQPMHLLPAAQLANSLKAGSAAIFPTDTLPALAATPGHAAQLWELKGRPQHKPVILMGADPEALFALLGTPVQTAWQQLAKAHWPGGLTLVLPAAGPIAQQLNPGGSSLGLRVPACPMALDLLRLSGPLATTSANRSGEPPCLSMAEAAARFGQVPLLGPAPWPTPSGQASTVLRWCAPGHWQLLRQGAVMPANLELLVP
jgi:L-threonylcarbamoyladenylate synthase